MEFWGVEVPAGKPTSCSPGDGMYLHVSQAALGESKDKSGKKIERVVVRVQVDESEVVLGTLSEGKCDQMPLDLVFDREFKISHNSNSSSVFICGYRTEGPDDFYDSEEEDEDEEEDEKEKSADVPAAVAIASNGDASGKHAKAGKHEKAAKPATESAISKAASTAADAITKAISRNLKKSQLVEDDESEEEDDSDDDSDEDEEFGHPFVSDLASESDDEFDAGSDEDMDDEDDDEDDDDDDEDDEFDSDESDEEELMVETLKSGKKRAAAGVPKAAASEKKSKVEVTPKPGQAPGSGKKGAKAGPVTPLAKSPATKEAKTPKDAKQQKAAKVPKGTPTTALPTPTSDKKLGPHKCTGCDKTFTTESAKTQHMAAKHKA